MTMRIGSLAAQARRVFNTMSSTHRAEGTPTWFSGA
jgi:hypothetical protein